MKYIADLHVHSKYSRAVSRDMVLPIMDQFARKKGIDILATSDWTHPLWLREIRAQLEESNEGLFNLKSQNDPTSEESGGHLRGEKNATLFVLSTEISSIYTQGGKVRRIHNLVLSPSFETCEKINQELVKRGCNLGSDGRPIVGLSSKSLLELVLSIDQKALFIPCHVWTPWFALYGSMSGFDSIEECFGDYSKYIYAVETGLSSDPEMNWRIKELETRSIVSSSDSHSPAKMGREATVFVENKNDPPAGGSNKQITFEDISLAIKRDQNGKLKIGYTIEFYPEEGKYHYTGHRNCKVVQDPSQTKEKGVTCPVCKKPLTVGVMHRVDELAHQQIKNSKFKVQNYEETVVTKLNKVGVKWYGDPKGIHPPFVKLVPLIEIVAESMSSTVASLKVKQKFNDICDNFGSEFNVLLKTEVLEIEKSVGPRIAEGVTRVRKGDIIIHPGFDGEYGKVKIWNEEKDEKEKKSVEVKKDEEKNQLGLF
ncbi:MAG: endonuclease Q family protein [Candidatus Levybacteria bacterium]|nr:endonuclease Q family protein [Candidatus Levybacteria bacterium]